MDTELRVVDSIEGFQGLREDWNELYNECHSTTIFSSWDWMFTWWEVFNKSINSQLFILTLYENKKLIGLAPFHINETFPKSLVQGRTLCFIGCGEEAQDKIVSQYSDFIVKPENKEKMISSVSRYLYESKNKWDFADFQFLLEGSFISECFGSQKYKVSTNLSLYGNRFYIPEMKNFDDFQNQMGNRWSKMLKKKSRKLDNDGQITIESSSDIESAKNAFKKLVDMHEARWENRSVVGIFESDLFNEFHLKILERLVSQKKAFINTLCLDGEALASYYYFIDKSQIHYYQSGFYSENANKYSPLFILVCKEIGLAIENEMLFDFMFDENPASYKKEQYAACSQPMYRLIWSPNKSRMIKHKYAKIIQAKYLKLRELKVNLIRKFVKK